MELAVCRETVTAAGEYLVGVGLVADIPHNTVVWGVEDIMQRHRQLEGSKA